MSGSASSWTDLASVLASADGRACLYGYLRAMDADAKAPRRLHRHIELLDEVALFRRQAGDTQKSAELIVQRYVTADSAAAGLCAAAPSPDELLSPGLGAERFRQLEEAAQRELRPFVPQFLSDVKSGERTVRQRVKESGYAAFTDRLGGGKKKSASTCTLC